MMTSIELTIACNVVLNSWPSLPRKAFLLLNAFFSDSNWLFIDVSCRNDISNISIKITYIAMIGTLNESPFAGSHRKLLYVDVPQHDQKLQSRQDFFTNDSNVIKYYIEVWS